LFFNTEGGIMRDDTNTTRQSRYYLGKQQNASRFMYLGKSEDTYAYILIETWFRRQQVIVIETIATLPTLPSGHFESISGTMWFRYLVTYDVA
jgi:hypothetical protein